MAEKYGYPIVGRYGLGNMLFPWARCVLWRGQSGARMIAPFWTQLRLGPYLRGERDKRAYQFLFRHDGYVSGINRLLLLATYSRFPETAACATDSQNRSIRVFKGMEGLFEPLIGNSALLRDELIRITRPSALGAAPAAKRYIAIHVRRGDFSVSEDESVLRRGGVNYRISLSWYAAALESLRKSLASAMPAFVFSDADESELQELLGLPAVLLHRTGTAVGDLLCLSRASALIASGSTFSMWGSFLGQTPSVWHPGQKRQALLGNGDQPHLEIELDVEQSIPPGFARSLLDGLTIEPGAAQSLETGR